MTLLLKALKIKSKPVNQRVINDEDIELAVALIKGEVIMAQAWRALKFKGHSGAVYSWLFRSLKQGFLEKKIIIDMVEDIKPKQSISKEIKIVLPKVEEKPKKRKKKVKPKKPKKTKHNFSVKRDLFKANDRLRKSRKPAILKPSDPKEKSFCQFSKCPRRGKLIQKSKMVGIYSKEVRSKVWFCSNKCLKGFDIIKIPVDK